MVDKVSLVSMGPCQLACECCPRGHDIDSIDISFSLTDFKAITTILVANGIHKFDISHILGETLLDSDLAKKIEWLETLNGVEEYYIYTNLIKLPDDVFEAMLEAEKLKLYVSVYGFNAEEYQLFTGSGRSFDTYLDNVRKLYGACVNFTAINMGKTEPSGSLGTILTALTDCLITNDHYANWGGLLDYPHVTAYRRGVCKNLLGVWPDGTVTMCGCYDIRKQSIIGNIRTDNLNFLFTQTVSDLISCQTKGIYTGICEHCNKLETEDVSRINTYS